MSAELLHEDEQAAANRDAPVALGWSRADVSRLAEQMAVHWDYMPGDPLEPLVKKLGGEIEFVEPGGIDENYGAIVVDGDGKFVISLPLDSGPMRDRFTVAHELGHYVLHYMYQRLINDREIFSLRANRFGSDSAEWEANWFAAALLMPAEKFRLAYAELGGDIAALADRFKVSQAAARVRVTSLNPFSA